MASDCDATRQGRTDAGVGGGGEGERDPAAAGRLQREAQHAGGSIDGVIKPHAGRQLARGGCADVRRAAAGGHAAGAAAGGGARRPPRQQQRARQQREQREGPLRTHRRRLRELERRCLRARTPAAQGVCHVSHVVQPAGRPRLQKPLHPALRRSCGLLLRQLLRLLGPALSPAPTRLPKRRRGRLTRATKAAPPRFRAANLAAGA